jgi:fructose-specific phosphotransferase system component IIB
MSTHALKRASKSDKMHIRCQTRGTGGVLSALVAGRLTKSSGSLTL